MITDFVKASTFLVRDNIQVCQSDSVIQVHAIGLFNDETHVGEKDLGKFKKTLDSGLQ